MLARRSAVRAPPPVRYALVRIGQQEPPSPPPTAAQVAAEERFTEAVRRAITPTMILVGIVTGLTFAVGGAIGDRLVRRYLFHDERRRR